MNQAVQSIDKPAALVSQAEKTALPFDTSPIRKEEFDAVLADTHGYIRSIACKWGPVLRRMGSSVDDATNDMILFAYHIREKISFDRISHFLKDCQTREDAVRRAFLALMKTSVHRRMINHVRNLKSQSRTFKVIGTDEVRDKLERKISRDFGPVDAAIFDEFINDPQVVRLQELQADADTRFPHRRFTDQLPRFQRRELAFHLQKAPEDLDRDPGDLAHELGIDPGLCAKWIGWVRQRGFDLFLETNGVKPVQSQEPTPMEPNTANQLKPVESQPAPKPKPISARQFIENQRLKPGSVLDADIVAAACGCRRRTAMMAIRKAGHIVKGSRVTEPQIPLQKPAKAPRSRSKRPEPRVQEKAAPWVNFQAIGETVAAGWGIARGFLGRIGSMLVKPQAPVVAAKPRSRRQKSR